MKRPLSYSSYSSYHVCPRKYQYEKIDRIVPASTPYHLVFGSCVDKALNALLESHSDPLAHATLELARLYTEEIEVLRKDVWDDIHELLEAGPIHCIIAELQSLGWKDNNVKALADMLFAKLERNEALTPGQAAALKTIVFYTAREKAKTVVARFEKHITPLIEEMVSVQKDVKRGIVDFEARLKGIDGIVMLDNKTASKPYKRDAVEYSVQLAGYQALIGAYVVFDKKDNSAKPQLIIQEVPEHNRTLVEEAYQNTEKLIECGVFPRNLNACGKTFGKPCPYVGLCWKNSMKGLVKKHEKS